VNVVYARVVVTAPDVKSTLVHSVVKVRYCRMLLLIVCHKRYIQMVSLMNEFAYVLLDDSYCDSFCALEYTYVDTFLSEIKKTFLKLSAGVLVFFSV